MEKKYMLVRYVLALLMLAALAGCASTAKQESTGQFIDDSVITSKVKALLIKDQSLKGFEISVKTYKGIVQLSGFVSSAKTVGRAGEIARSVSGVRSVKNDLIVK